MFISLVIAGLHSSETGEEEKKRVDLTRDIIIQTAEVLYRYRLENGNTWPAAMSDLAPYAPVLAANARNGVGQPLTLVPPTPANHPTDPIVVRTDLLTAELAVRVRSEFPVQARAGTGATVDIEIPVPGHEPPVRVQELLVRDGTREMTGDLDMAGNAIDDVGNFQITDQLDVGRDLNIGTELVVGERITVGGQTLTADGARFLVEMAGLNCGPDRLLNIAGRQATCVDFNPTGSHPPPVLPPAVPGVSITGGSAVTEGGDAAFTLTPTVPFTSAVTIVLRVTDDGGDFIASGDEGRKTVTFPAGTSSVTWSVPTVDDSAAEPSGRVTVSIEPGAGYVPYAPTSASVDVSDNDGGPPPACPSGTTGTPPNCRPVNPLPGTPVITVTAHAGAITEGGIARFTIGADRTSASAITIGLDVSDDASSDFLASSREGRKTVILPAGARTVAYSILTVDDTTDESNGRVTVRVASSGSDYAVGSPSSAYVSVNDNDPTPAGVPAISVTANPGSITEGGLARFTIRASKPWSSPISVSLDVSDDPGSGDFLAPASEGRKTVTLPANARTVPYELRTVDDTADEPNGQVSVRVASSGSAYIVGSPSTANVRVNDNDAGGGPRISIAGGTPVTEGDDAVFTLTADRVPTADISVLLDVSDDVGPSDFLAAPNEGRKTVIMAAGVTSVGYPLPTVDDSLQENDGQVSVRILGSTGYTVGSRASASVSVSDDDSLPPSRNCAGHVTEGSRCSWFGPWVTNPWCNPVFDCPCPSGVSGKYPFCRPTVTIAGGGATDEGGNAVFTLSASGTATPQRPVHPGLRIQLNVSDDPGTSDFLASSTEGRKTVTLPANDRTASFQVPTVDDNVVEPNGSVSVSILPSGGHGTGDFANGAYNAGSPSSGSVSVRDNDGTPPPTTPLSAPGCNVPAADVSATNNCCASDTVYIRYWGWECFPTPPAGPWGVPTPTSNPSSSCSLLSGEVSATNSCCPGGTMPRTQYPHGVCFRPPNVDVCAVYPSLCPCSRPSHLHPDAVWSGPPDCESSCGPVRVRNVLTIVNDQTNGRTWYQLTDISGASDCPVVDLGIGGNRRWKTRCDPNSRTGDYLQACGPWQSQIYDTDEGACGVEYCLATPLSFYTSGGRGHLESTAGSLNCPDPGSTTFSGIDFTTYRCPHIQPGVDNNWIPR